MFISKGIYPLRSPQLEPLERRQLLSGSPTQAQLIQDAADAYIYGLAPVIYRFGVEEPGTAVANPTNTGSAPINQFSNRLTFPPPNSGVSPNADTLYSTANLDLTKEPIILHQANTNGRYVLFQLLDAYTDTFASLGSEYYGSQAQNYLIAGPNWVGKAPAGVTVIHSPTNLVWVIGRTQTLDTPADIAAVNQLQAQYSLTPLSHYGDPNYTPPTNVPVTPPTTVTYSSPQSFYTALAQALRKDPPPKRDAGIVKELAQIGIGPADNFTWANLSPALQQDFTSGLAAGQARFTADLNSGVALYGGLPSRIVNGWTLALANVGTYGTDYDARAVTAVYGIGANPPIDAIYPSTSVDANGNHLNGSSSSYVVHFDNDQIPPAGAFWSLTVYQNGQFYANSISRYSTGSLHPELIYNSDGSLDIYLQNATPANSTKDGNWLPIPAGPFTLTLRLYEPGPSVFNGTWSPPAVQVAAQAASSHRLPSLLSPSPTTVVAEQGTTPAAQIFGSTPLVVDNPWVKDGPKSSDAIVIATNFGVYLPI